MQVIVGVQNSGATVNCINDHFFFAVDVGVVPVTASCTRPVQMKYTLDYKVT
jgi:hypothetical protein